MNHITDALKDVEKYFSEPQEIILSRELTREQKVQLLKQWETDVREKMVACEEGMTGDRSGKDAALLKSVRSHLMKLGEDKDESMAPNKAGG